MSLGNIMNKRQSGTHPVVILLASTFGLMPLIAAEGTGEEVREPLVRIQPYPALQAEIRGIAAARSSEELNAGLERIRTLCGNDYDKLVSQLLHHGAQSDDGRGKTVIGRILRHLELPEQSTVSALVPHLDSEDDAVNKIVRSLLHGHEDRSAGRPPDFSAYRAIIEEKVRAGDEPRLSLVRFMYESDPGRALLTLMRGTQLRAPEDLRTILWAEHVVSDMLWKRQYGFIKPKEIEPAALEQLEKLSVHEVWWARLYVAEMLRRHPELRRPEWLQRLTQDDHPLVRERASLAVAERQSKGLDQTRLHPPE